ncbi:MAG: hypothetical protein IJ240_00355, partial [Clostridia bacterium]|nr:hypothetical protein [Clostridia bacterium]
MLKERKRPFFQRGFAKRLFSILLVLSILLNMPAVAVDEAAAVESHSLEIDEGVVINAADPEIIESGEVDLELAGDSDIEDYWLEDNTFTFDLGMSQNVLLSTILAVNELPLDMKWISDVVVLGAPVVDEKKRKAQDTEYLSIEPVEEDYMITVLWEFLEAGIAVYTIDDEAYTFKLTNIYDPEIAERIEADLERYYEGVANAIGQDLTTDAPIENAADTSDDALSPSYIYSFNGANGSMLSEIFEAIGISIDLSEVEAVGLLGGYSDAPDELIFVEQIEDNYAFTVLKDFQELGVAVYTADDQYTILLTDGKASSLAEEPTEEPTPEPTAEPTEETTEEPTEAPAEETVEEIEVVLTETPPEEPTPEPTEEPTSEPTEEPTPGPTEEPTPGPTEEPTPEPTEEPMPEPTEEPTPEPTEEPTPEPTEEPTPEPTEEPIEISYPAQTFNGGTAFVRVNVEAPEGAFPEGTTMTVTPVWDRDTIADFTDAVSEDNLEIQRCFVVDITFYDADGNEIEPLAPVSVKMSMAARMDDQQEALVAHMDDAGAVELMEQTEAAESDGSRVAMSVEIGAAEQIEAQGETSVRFDADGFSMYALMLAQYTVDFHWGDYTYSIEGESGILLSALFEKLGVTEISVADVQAATFSDETLVKVEQQAGDWLLSSLAPFDTEETLTLTLTNGQTVAIKVTDERVIITANEGLIYNGQDQSLVAVSGGNNEELLFAIGENAETAPEDTEGEEPKWGADIPAISDAGTYYVWYKNLTDEDDPNPKCIPVTIAQKPVTVTADDFYKRKGDQDPDFTATVEDLLGEDSLTY